MARFITVVVHFIALLSVTGHSASAFVTPQKLASRLSRCQVEALPTAEESAQALTDYMAKSHEEKLKAVRAAEEKNRGELESLKAEIALLKGGSPAANGRLVAAPSPSNVVPSGSVEELKQRITQYQDFMAKYIVEAQEAKARAVEEAKAAVTKKYEAKLLAAGIPVASPPPPASLSGAPQVPKLFQERNARVSAAAAAGKSRWGDSEVQRVAGASTIQLGIPPTADVVPVPAVPAPVSVSTPVSGPVPPEVVAADHGLRANGAVGGLSLAERVAMGAGAPSEANGVVTATSREEALYYQRNKKVAAAGAARSRWGPMEVAKASELAALPAPSASQATVVSTPEIEAADHGLRADGGVGGPSLAERVNLGAQLLGAH